MTEKMTVVVPADSGTDLILRFGDGVGFVGYRVSMPRERAEAIATRWNACAAAFAALDKDDSTDFERVYNAIRVLDEALPANAKP